MREKIAKICEDLCCRPISREEELITSGLLDSFKIMELICSLEEAFDITFLPDEIMDLEHFSSVEKLVEFVSSKVSCLTG